MEQIWNQMIVGPLMQALIWLQSIAGSYGGAVVLLAIVVKVVVLPLAIWQTGQSRVLTQLQPQIELLRRQYGNDQARFAQEQMNLFGKAGIHPVLGCVFWPLTLVINLGLLIGLYQIARSVNEFQAGFLWLPSLALPNGWPISEPRLYYLALPVLVFILLIIQQRVSVAGGATTGLPIGRSGWFGPLIFGAILALLPAGLTLFATTGSLFDLIYLTVAMKWAGSVKIEPARLKAQLRKADQIQATRPDKARRSYVRIISVVESARSANSETRQIQAQAYMGLGRLDEKARQATEAIANYRKAGALGLAEATLRMATLLVRQGKNDAEAEQAYLVYLRARRGTVRTTDDIAVLSMLEQLCQVREGVSAAQLHQAIGRNQLVIDADPAVEWAHFYLGLAQFLSEHYQEARAALEQAKRLDSERTATYVYLGRAYLALAQLEAAMEALQEVLRRDPRQPAVASQLGKLALDPLLVDVQKATSPDGRRRLDLADKWLEQATGLDRSQEEPFYYLGRAKLLRQAYAEAVKAFQRAIDLNGQRKESFYYMAVAHNAAGSSTPAIAALEKAIALDGNYAEAHNLLADLCFAKRSFRRAAQHYREVVRLDRDNASAHRYLGRCLYELGEYSQAIAELTGVAAHYPDALFYLARSQAKQGQFDAAIASLRQLTRGAAPDAQAFYYLGCAYANAGQAGRSGAFDAARAAFSECLKIDSQRWEAHVQIGHVYLRQSQPDEARQHYRQAQALQPQSAAVLYAQGMLAWVDGNLLQAEAMLKQSLKQVRDYAPSHLALGAIYEQRGDIGDASCEYEAAGAFGPLGVLACKQGDHARAQKYLLRAQAAGEQNDIVLNALGFSQAMLKQYADALRNWERLRERQPDDTRLTLNIMRLHYLLGSEHAHAGRYAEAAREWEHCLTLYSGDDQLRHELAEVYFRLGHAELQSPNPNGAARQALLRAVELNEARNDYDYHLAVSELLAKEYETAAGRLRHLLETDPEQAGYAYHLGLALLNLGQVEPARELIERVAAGATGELAQRARWALATLHMRAGQWATAADMLQAA